MNETTTTQVEFMGGFVRRVRWGCCFSQAGITSLAFLTEAGAVLPILLLASTTMLLGLAILDE